MLLFNVAVVFSSIYFRFPFVKAQLIGDWHESRQDHLTYNLLILMAHRCTLPQLEWRTEPGKKSGEHTLNIIGAPMHPAPIGMADRCPLRR